MNVLTPWKWGKAGKRVRRVRVDEEEGGYDGEYYGENNGVGLAVDPLKNRPWSSEFNLDDPSDIKKAYNIYQLERRVGAEFAVYKEGVTQLGYGVRVPNIAARGKRITGFDHFPTIDEVAAAVEVILVQAAQAAPEAEAR